ncbi:MAG: CARDB domain-containing protein, partial [Anaerolineae bacterium]
MGDNQRSARPICLARALFLLLTLLLMRLPPVHPVWAQQPVELLYAADFDDETAPGWSLDSSNEGRWVAQVGELIGKGRAWAVYKEGYHWGGAGSYWYRFQLRYLEGTLHASIRTSEGRRYAIGLRNTDGLLNVELFKESPAGAFVELEPPQVLDFELPNEPPGFWVEIHAEEGRIELYVRDYTQEPVLVGEDDDPLPPGTLAFETLDDGVARINAVEVWGPPGQAGLPDLAILDAVWRLEEDLLVLRARVENQGPVESGPSEVYVELRPPQLGTVEPLPPLAPGQSEDVFLYLEFPQELRGETIGLVFNVDPDQRVEEADEGNNTVRLRGTTDPLEPPEREGLPDLTIADAGWHLKEDQDLLELRVLVENQGEAGSGDSDVYAELPPPGRGTTEPLPPLAPGQSRNVSLNLEFPRELRGETIGLFINVDPGQRVEESNENNNADELKVTTDRPEPPGVPLAPIVAGVAALALGGLIYGLVRALRGKPGTEP